MEEKKQQDIALFKYGLISPVLHETRANKMEYFRQMSKKEFDIPHIGKRRCKVGTIKSWLRAYRSGGFDALKPKIRADKGTSRKIDDELAKIIKERVESFGCLSSAAIFRLLISEGDIKPDQVTEGTVRKYISDNKLKIATKEIVGRKKFEKEHINELWIADSLHGPYLMDEKRKRQVFLISIIDDYSRCIVGGKFFFSREQHKP